MLIPQTIKQANLIDKVNLSEVHPLPFKFAHGELANLAGYDIVYSNSKEESDVLNNLEGIYDIEIFLENKNKLINMVAYIVNAKAFIWKIPGLEMTKGLIVLENDKESYKYAFEAYSTKQIVL